MSAKFKVKYKFSFLLGVVFGVTVVIRDRSLSKPRRQRRRDRSTQRREQHQTKDLMSRTMAVRVSYKSLYIWLLSVSVRVCEDL